MKWKENRKNLGKSNAKLGDIEGKNEGKYGQNQGQFQKNNNFVLKQFRFFV